MEFNIPNEDLARIASDSSNTGDFADDVVDLFRQTLQIVAAVPSESALQEFQCLRYYSGPQSVYHSNEFLRYSGAAP